MTAVLTFLNTYDGLLFALSRHFAISHRSGVGGGIGYLRLVEGKNFEDDSFDSG